MGHDLFIHLHDSLRARANAGEVNLFTQLQSALPGWRLLFRPDTPLARLQTRLRRAFGLFHMHPPPASGRVLCLRRAYFYPFWRLERTAQRWDFDVAHAPFPGKLDPRAHAFMARWRNNFFAGHTISSTGFVLIPLQGQVQSCRGFQTCSPLEMIEETLSRDPRPLRATLHPKETYPPADLRALEDLSRRFPRFQLVTAPTTALLAACDRVVTQNSSVALTGFFAQKPAILFAQSDFHHIAGSVPRDGLDAAFDAPPPDADRFAAYLHWFFQDQAINAGAPDAPKRLNARLRALGWPVPDLSC